MDLKKNLKKISKVQLNDSLNKFNSNDNNKVVNLFHLFENNNEDETNNEIIITNYFCSQLESLKFRNKLLGWLYSINLKLKASYETFFKAIKFYDVYLLKSKKEFQVKDLQLIISVCYLIAYKLEEVNLIDLSFIKENILKNKYEAIEITNCEIKILKVLNFKLQIQTLNSKTQLFIDILKNNIKDDEIINYLERIINYCNAISLMVEDFMFNFKSLDLIKINVKIALRLLYENNLIIENEYFEKYDLIFVNCRDSNDDKFEELLDKYYRVIKNKYDFNSDETEDINIFFA